MTSQPRRPPDSSLLLSGIALTAWTTLSGCSEEPPPPPPAPVVIEEAPEPPPPEPTVTSIAELKKRLGISDKVQLAEGDAPDTDEARIAVLKFFDAFAKGDDKAAMALASAPDKAVLTAMVTDGSWKSSTSDIDFIEIKTGTNPDSSPVAFGLFAFVQADDQAGVWIYSATEKTASFDAEMTPEGIMDSLSATDPIGSWYAAIAAFLALAEEPDVKIEIVQEDLTVKDDGSSEPSDDGDGGGMGGGGAPMRRKPVDTPVRPGRPGNPGSQ